MCDEWKDILGMKRHSLFPVMHNRCVALAVPQCALSFRFIMSNQQLTLLRLVFAFGPHQA
jgi:hypothetical protein